MKGNKGVSLVGVVITILVIMLILSVGVCVYLIQNPVKENVVAQNPEQVVGLNSLKNDNSVEVIKNTSNMKLIKIDDEESFNEEGKIYNYIYGEDGDKSIIISYTVNGKNKGKLEITKDAKKIHTQLLEKSVISINSLNYTYERNVFLLFEDGTVGKIKISDINNNKFEIQKVDGINNIIRIQEILFQNEGAGSDFVLIGINNEGKIVTLDIASD